MIRPIATASGMTHPITSPWSLVTMMVLGMMAGRLQAAEESPPGSWNARAALEQLRSLEDPLARKPDDPALLGLVLDAYATLSLGWSDQSDGSCGPWLGYADLVAERRRAVRGAAMPATVAGMAPEIRLAWLHGRVDDAERMLGQYPYDPADSGMRALSLLTRRDGAVWPERPQITPGEIYAGLRLAEPACDLESRIPVEAVEAIRSLKGRCDPWLQKRLYWRTRYGQATTELVPNVLAGVVWMLSTMPGDDPTVMDDLRALATALGITATAVEPHPLQEAAYAAIGDMDAEAAGPLAVAIRIVNARRAMPRAVFAAGRPWRLAGPGDIAGWLAARAHETAFLAWRMLVRDDLNKQGKNGRTRSDAYRNEILRTAPDTLIAARLMVGRVRWDTDPVVDKDDKPDPVALDRLADAVLKETGGPADLGPNLLAESLLALTHHHHARLPACFDRVLSRTVAGSTRQGLDYLLEAADGLGRRAEIGTLILATARRDPRSLPWAKRSWHFDPAIHLLDARYDQPTATWSEPSIDHAGPWKQLPARSLSIQWEGLLTVPAAGLYGIRLETSSTARLVVGGTVIEVGGRNGSKGKSSTTTTVRLPAGPVAILLDYSQWWSRSPPLCRLSWQPPASGDAWQVVPADRFSHGQESSGLLVRGWGGNTSSYHGVPSFSHGSPTALVEERAAAMPWSLDWQLEAFNNGWRQERFRDIAAIGRAILGMKDGISHIGRQVATCQLFLDPPDIESFLRIAKSGRFSSDNELMGAYFYRGQELGLQQRIWDLDHDDLKDPYDGKPRMLHAALLGSLALDLGDFAEADRLMELGAKDKWSPPRPAIASAYILKAAVMARMHHHDINEKRITEWLSMYAPDKESIHQRIHAAMQGEQGWGEVRLLARTGVDRTSLSYFQGLVALSTGHHDLARRFLAESSTAGGCGEAWSATALLAWYKSQDDRTLSALPKADPWPEVAAPPPINF